MAGSTTVFNVAGVVTGLADADLAQFIRVKITATGYAVAAKADRADGITQEAIASGAYGSIKLLSGADVNFGTASGATIAAGVKVYSTSAGELSSTKATGSFEEGVSITAAGADEIFEWRYKPSSVAES
jgi:hypothetical protein